MCFLSLQIFGICENDSFIVGICVIIIYFIISPVMYMRVIFLFNLNLPRIHVDFSRFKLSHDLLWIEDDQQVLLQKTLGSVQMLHGAIEYVGILLYHVDHYYYYFFVRRFFFVSKQLLILRGRFWQIRVSRQNNSFREE